MHGVKREAGGLYGMGLYAIKDDEQKAQAGVDFDNDCSMCTTVDKMVCLYFNALFL
jgi:hypothetical protein